MQLLCLVICSVAEKNSACHFKRTVIIIIMTISTKPQAGKLG